VPRTPYPVHDRITVIEGETIYKTEEWWKAAVRHSIEGRDKGVAVYLWNRDEGSWTRKNKYRIATVDAWKADRVLVTEHLTATPPESGEQAYPVSDYYTVANGETVFKTDDWWKAVLTVSEKANYETHEVFIYVWQSVNGDWRRRQKYAVKDEESWEEDQSAVNRLWDEELNDAPDSFSAEQSADDSGNSTAVPASRAGSNDGAEILAQLQEELQSAHLGT
jgi:hypothetical protein